MKLQYSKLFYRVLIPTSIIMYIFISQSYNSNLSFGNKIKIFCIILTKPSSLFSKAEAVHKTWASECDKYFFITTLNLMNINKTVELVEPLPILQPAYYLQENYSTLTDKVFPIFKHIYEHYNYYDWYLKADDDTFIFMDNLRKFLKDKNPSKPVTYGHNWDIHVEGGYESGGAGYVLSNEAINRLGQKLTENYSFCLNTGIEDIDTARCLRQLGVKSDRTPDEKNRQRFHAFNFRQEGAYSRKNGFIDSTISFHYVNATEMYKLYKLWKNYLKKIETDGENSGDFSSILHSLR